MSIVNLSNTLGSNVISKKVIYQSVEKTNAFQLLCTPPRLIFFFWPQILVIVSGDGKIYRENLSSLYLDNFVQLL